MIPRLTEGLSLIPSIYDSQEIQEKYFKDEILENIQQGSFWKAGSIHKGNQESGWQPRLQNQRLIVPIFTFQSQQICY